MKSSNDPKHSKIIPNLNNAIDKKTSKREILYSRGRGMGARNQTKKFQSNHEEFTYTNHVYPLPIILPLEIEKLQQEDIHTL